MKLRSSAWVAVGALLCLALTPAAAAAPAGPPEEARMVAFELFAPPATSGGG